MDGAAILVPIAFFATIAAIFILPGYFNSKERQHMQDTLRTAIDKGQPLPPEVIEAVAAGGKFLSTRTQDFRKAVIWLAVAGGIATIGAIVGWHEGYDDEHLVPFAFAAVPAFVGIAYLALGLLNKDKK
jgi:hypothetical protein